MDLGLRGQEQLQFGDLAIEIVNDPQVHGHGLLEALIVESFEHVPAIDSVGEHLGERRLTASRKALGLAGRSLCRWMRPA